MCRSSRKIIKVFIDNDTEELFLGDVTIDAVEANQSSWKVDIGINNKVIQFKIVGLTS